MAKFSDKRIEQIFNQAEENGRGQDEEFEPKFLAYVAGMEAKVRGRSHGWNTFEQQVYAAGYVSGNKQKGS